MQHEAGDYPEAAEIYDYEHNSKDQTIRGNQDDYNSQDGDKDYYSTYVQYHHNEDGRQQQQQQQQQQSGEEEMW